MQNIAVIGGGIAGLSCAWLLSKKHEVTVFERGARAGGHSNTIEVTSEGRKIPVDTGFIVYNEPTYPNLTALFKHLGVPSQASDMSFAASLDDGALEYSGKSLTGLFGQPQNLFRPRFWRMVRDLLRLYREAPKHLAALAGGEAELVSLDAWLDSQGFGPELREDHLLPMAAAIWSTPAGTVGQYPVAAFLKFCDTHGLVRLRNRPEWRTVTGGSQEYVRRLTAPFAARIFANTPIGTVRRYPGGVEIRTEAGTTHHFDQVVVATHAPQALAMLADPTSLESDLLGKFVTTANRAVLHTDESLMPRRRGVWSAWNFLGDRGGVTPPCVTYWMNCLQKLPTRENIFVTLNPPREPAPGTLLLDQSYAHPLFDAAAIAAQGRLWSLQGVQNTWFCGAWFGAGFHEDGLQAGLATAEALGGVRRPWDVANESGRIHLGPLSRPALEPVS